MILTLPVSHGFRWLLRQSWQQTLIEFLTPSFRADEGLRKLLALARLPETASQLR